MLPPPHRLRRAADVARVRQGRRWPHPLVVLFVSVQPAESSSASRFAFAAGRHVGNAPRRNRVKRRLREIVRLHLDQLAPGRDCLFLARTAAAIADYGELEQAVLVLLARAGLRTDDSPVDGKGGSPS